MTRVQTLLLALLLLMAAAGCIPAKDTKDDPNPAEMLAIDRTLPMTVRRFLDLPRDPLH